MSSLSTLLVALAVLCSFGLVEAKTVVLFSPPHAANVRTYTNTGRALVTMGHTVYVPVPDFMLKEKTLNDKGINVIRYGEALGHVDDRIVETMVDNFWANGSIGFGEGSRIMKLADEVISHILTDKQLMKKFREIKPDLIVLVNLPPFRNFVLLPYILDVPFAFLGPFHDYTGSRVPVSFASSPTLLMDDFQETDLTFMQRLKNTVVHLGFIAAHIFVSSEAPVAKFAPHRPRISTNEIHSQAEIHLVEQDHLLDYARPRLPNTVFIGSTAGNPPNELKEPFKSFMDQASNGVVVVTFGSSVLEFPEYVSSKMASAFSKLDMHVVWRVNIPSPDRNKILASTWIPQNDLLGHKNTKLFVSHCGMNGQYEGMYHAVPTLCLPMFGDMPYNAQRGVNKGFGLRADIRKISDVEFLALMKEMVDNPKYKNAIKKASDIHRELYKLPTKEAAFWLNHVMKYGGAYMRSPGQNMPLYQFLSIDIFAFFAIGIALVAVITFKMCCCCCGLCCRKTGKPKID